MNDRILILSPHTDDGELGCGATIAKFIEEGKDVYYVAFSTAEKSVPKGYPKNILETEVKKATSALGITNTKLIIYKFEVRKLNYVRQEILEELVKLKEKIRPNLVFMPSLNDLHQDHKTIAIEAMRAFKQSSILAYELPWNNITFSTQCFIKLNISHISKKIEALKAYQSQKHRKYLNDEFIISWARTRGVQINEEFAECFEVIRWII